VRVPTKRKQLDTLLSHSLCTDASSAFAPGQRGLIDTPAVCCAHVGVGVHSEEPMAEVRWATRSGRKKMLMAKKKRRWVGGSDRVCEFSV
jgi:hypothetical protein